MPGRTWVAADHHFGHPNIVKFKDDNDNLLRGALFPTLEEHDEALIARHNALVDPGDRVYLLGDVAIARRGVHSLGRLNGRLVLVKGNHDIFSLKDYLPYVEDIRSCVVQKDGDGNKVILTHIPIHPDCLGRFGINIHGHLHQNRVMQEKTEIIHTGIGEFTEYTDEIDPRYICVSLEHTGYAPIQIHEALKRRTT